MRNKITDKIRQMVKTAYAEISDEFDQTRKVQWAEFQEFLKYVKQGAKVLDLGCGNGRFFELIKSKNVDYLGIDNSSNMIEKAKNNFSDANFQLGDMVELDLPDKTFDIVISIASFHHIPSIKLRQKACLEMQRVVKNDGVLILTVWNLFQFRYLINFIKSIISFIFHLGFKYQWNDLWIKWGNYPIKRYYHAFLPSELLKYFKKDKWQIEDFYFARKDKRVKFWHSFNICLIARKIRN